MRRTREQPAVYSYFLSRSGKIYTYACRITLGVILPGPEAWLLTRHSKFLRGLLSERVAWEGER